MESRVELSDLTSESEEEGPRTVVDLTATQQPNTEFEPQAARAGMCGVISGLMLCHSQHKQAQGQLDLEDLDEISVFNIHVIHSTTEACFEDI